MSKKIENLLKLATQYENSAFEKSSPINYPLGLNKTASGDFAKVCADYDTTELLLIDFIEGMKMSIYNSYNEGKGFEDHIRDILLKQVDLVASAIETVMPEIKALDEEIYK